LLVVLPAVASDDLEHERRHDPRFPHLPRSDRRVGRHPGEDVDVRGERVARVELLRVEFGGPAKRAGLARGDVIVAWGGDPVRDVGALQSKVERVEEACRVKIVVLRESRRSEVDLRVELEPEGK